MTILDELEPTLLDEKRSIDIDEARGLVDLPAAELPRLLGLAHEVRRRWWGEGVELESLISAQTGGCQEDCAFCSQSMHYDAPAQRHAFLPLDQVLAAARATEESGASAFCIVVAVRGPDRRLMDQVLRAIEAIHAETALDVDCSLGILTRAQAEALRDAGVHHYNHNLETARSFFPEIVTTHTWEERAETCRLVTELGIKLCSGGILGMGETWEQRLELAYELRELGPDEIPLNFLNPRPGTPLAGRRPLEAHDALRAIAIFRLVFPDRIIRYAGGRELVLRDAQALGLVGGVNGMIVGNYLTTAGRPAAEDVRLARDLGMPVVPGARADARTPTPRTSGAPAMTAQELLELDRAHVWHPYAPMPGTHPPLLVESASGVRLRLAEPVAGHDELVDGMSSWWSAIHGYAHPALDAAAHDQIERMSHVMFGGLTHEPAVGLARRLVEITPEPLRHVFLCDSGSVSVEVAVKMCLQYQRARGRPGRHRLLTWRGGYYGDTLTPMSLCDPDGGMHHLWSGILPRQVFADAPPDGFDAPADAGYLDHLASLVEEHAGELAAIIVEPVVQGAGGMRFHSPAYLGALRALADAHDLLLVFDEIATGFGRSGALFAAGHAGVSPDVMCVGKAMTGGYLTMAAALCTPRVAEAISTGEVPVLAHGPTFMGNPLAAAVANASIDLLLAQDWGAEVTRVEAGLRAGLAPAGDLPGVADVRVLGAIGVVQLDHEVDVAAASRAAAERGVWLRPFRDLVYTMPPYVTGDDDLAAIGDAVVAAAAVG